MGRKINDDCVTILKNIYISLFNHRAKSVVCVVIMTVMSRMISLQEAKKLSLKPLGLETAGKCHQRVLMQTHGKIPALRTHLGSHGQLNSAALSTVTSLLPVVQR